LPLPAWSRKLVVSDGTITAPSANAGSLTTLKPTSFEELSRQESTTWPDASDPACRSLGASGRMPERASPTVAKSAAAVRQESDLNDAVGVFIESQRRVHSTRGEPQEWLPDAPRKQVPQFLATD